MNTENELKLKMMTTIQLPLDERLVQKIGVEAIKQRIKNELEILYVEFLAKEINQELKTSGIENEKELEHAREQAWKEITRDFLSF